MMALRLCRALAVASVVAAGGGLSSGTATAKPSLDSFLTTLNDADRRVFEAYYAAQTFHNAARDAYWAKVTAKRKRRRAAIRSGRKVGRAAYVTGFPPAYTGPKVPKRLWKRWRAYQAKDRTRSKRRTTFPTAADYLALARNVYGFVPERIPEREFKRRYAREALALGLTKRQVIRVYALETGGRGTADMVAGVSPITGRGNPISSALGYAQLLAANTINVLQKHGNAIEQRLVALRKRSRTQARRDQLTAKLRSLRKMRAVVRTIPARWSAQRALSRTDRGRGMHALNIDGDIGPWIQVKKLAGVRGYGLRAGYTSLTSEQLELMNLAGPGTGIEMMTAIGMKMPTSNFFSRQGYERNSVVRGRTSAQLIVALGKRMDRSERNPGALEFAEVFDELLRARNADPPRLLSKPSRVYFRQD